MEVIRAGKRAFALGLTWREGEPGTAPAPQARALAKAAGHPLLWTSVEAEDGRVVLGTLDAASKPPARIRSAAEALAAAGRSGLFVYVGAYDSPGSGRRSAVAKPMAWYVAIVDGAVVPDTDTFVPVEEAPHLVGALHEALSVPVYLDGELAGIEATEFNLRALLGNSKVKPMRKAGGDAAGVIVLSLVIAGLAVGGWWMVKGSKQKSAAQAQAEAEAQQRQTYIDTLRPLVEQPADAGWALDALRAALAAFPAYESGWALDGVKCVPASCTAVYSTQADRLRSAVPFEARFGRIKLSDDGLGMEVSIPLSVPMASWPDDALLSPPPLTGRASDVLGQAATITSAKIEAPKREDKSAAAGGLPPGATVGVTEESFTATSAAAPVEPEIAGLVALFGRAGFVPASLSFSRGTGKIAASWSATFSRFGAP